MIYLQVAEAIGLFVMVIALLTIGKRWAERDLLKKEASANARLLQAIQDIDAFVDHMRKLPERVSDTQGPVPVTSPSPDTGDKKEDIGSDSQGKS